MTIKRSLKRRFSNQFWILRRHCPKTYQSHRITVEHCSENFKYLGKFLQNVC